MAFGKVKVDQIESSTQVRNVDDLVALALASQAEAEAGTANDKLMTPLRTAQAIAALASGAVLQVVTSNPAPAQTTISATSWTEVNSGFRATITPQSSSSTLIISCTFLFGGNFSNELAHLKIYDITNSADVNLHTGSASRTPMHGSVRQVDGDSNDVDNVTINVAVTSATTSARTYGLYFKNEGSAVNKYFFGTSGTGAQMGIVRPLFQIIEVG